MDARQDLQDFIGRRVAAVLDRDVTTLVEAHDAEVRQFPVLPPTVTSGRAAVEEGLGAWLDGYESGPTYEVRELEVVSAGELGVCSFFYHVGGTLVGGAEVDMWVRSTQVCRRDPEGEWRIIHSHESVPFDVDTGLALLDAAPPDAG